MRTSKCLSLLFVSALILLTLNAARGGVVVPVLNVDIESSSGGVTESGFQSMTATPTVFSTGLGSVTVSISGGDGFYPRNSMGGSIPYKDLYNDFYYLNGA